MMILRTEKDADGDVLYTMQRPRSTSQNGFTLQQNYSINNNFSTAKMLCECFLSHDVIVCTHVAIPSQTYFTIVTLFPTKIQGIVFPFGSVHLLSRSFFHLSVLLNVC